MAEHFFFKDMLQHQYERGWSVVSETLTLVLNTKTFAEISLSNINVNISMAKKGNIKNNIDKENNSSIAFLKRNLTWFRVNS